MIPEAVRDIPRNDSKHGRTRALHSVPARSDEVRLVPINVLQPGDTPRLSGEDSEHARLLADSSVKPPPILVHRRTMRVIDGMHRLRASQLAGRNMMDVVFFDGSEEDAFVRAVQANVTHGLPLSLADREAAAVRIIGTHGHWSDRAIAAVAGLAPKTVASLRRRVSGDRPEASGRLGRDGRVRPLDAAEGRRIASEIIAQRPDASLREVAKAAGISPTTVRDVRSRMRMAAEPAEEAPPAAVAPVPAPRENCAAPTPPRSAVDKTALILSLGRDPSLRFKQSGRVLLQWLMQHSDGLESWSQLIDSIPLHCSYVLANLSRDCAREWLTFAEELEGRVATDGESH